MDDVIERILAGGAASTEALAEQQARARRHQEALDARDEALAAGFREAWAPCMDLLLQLEEITLAESTLAINYDAFQLDVPSLHLALGVPQVHQHLQAIRAQPVWVSGEQLQADGLSAIQTGLIRSGQNGIIDCLFSWRFQGSGPVCRMPVEGQGSKGLDTPEVGFYREGENSIIREIRRLIEWTKKATT